MAATLKSLLATAAVVVALGASAIAHSQGDPTRPPSNLMAEPSAGAAAAGAPAPKPLSLQALRLGPDLAPSALLDGRVVHVGDRVREDMRVLAITAQGVQLGHPNKPGESNWLRISPNVKKSQAGHESP
ncbi:MAG TPA: hypothetical protein VGM81_07970 [Burkholderiaceae bacterium]